MRTRHGTLHLTYRPVKGPTPPPPKKRDLLTATPWPRCVMALILITLGLTAAWSAPRIGRLFVAGNEIQAPFVYRISADTLYVNEIVVRPLPPGPEIPPRDQHPRDRSIREHAFHDSLRRVALPLVHDHVSPQHILEIMLDLCRHSALVDSARLSGTSTIEIFYRDELAPILIPIPADPTPPPTARQRQELITRLLNDRLTAMREGLSNGGLILVGRTYFISIPSGRSQKIIDAISAFQRATYAHASATKTTEALAQETGLLLTACQDLANPTPLRSPQRSVK